MQLLVRHKRGFKLLVCPHDSFNLVLSLRRIHTVVTAVFWNTFNKGNDEYLRIIRVVSVGCEPEQEKSIEKLVGKGQA